jgi:predicted phosphodiesterase
VPRPLVSGFAVEDTSIQVAWRALPAPEVVLELGDQTVPVAATPVAYRRRRGRPPQPLVTDVGACGGPGTVSFDGLSPDTTYELTVSGPGQPRTLVQRIATLQPPPGRLLSRFATINDLHIGERRFGALDPLEDVYPLPKGWETYTVRCARAALDEALLWGAEAIVVKGDITREGEPVEFQEAAQLFNSLPVPVEVTLGNHEFHDLGTDPWAALAESGIPVPRQPWARDLPGIRIILGHSWRRHNKSGRIDERQRRQLTALASASPTGVFIALHHQPQRWRLPNQYPPGIPGPAATALLDALGEANPATLVASGHTHRHRRHQHGPVVAVEVGSPKDYPGTWTGYAVYEGGIRQVVRRVAALEAISWTEGTYWALNGLWGRWSPGRLDDRCFSHTWPSGTRPQAAP